MSEWKSLLRRPDRLDDEAVASWFGAASEQLLNGTQLLVGREPHRFVEVEFYYHAPDHPDPFTHRDPVQFECGRWYFHRTRGQYRGGSFKGLDLTFGSGGASGGVLIRGLETPDGRLIDGPSLCVDHLLDCTAAAAVGALDRAIGARVAWDATNPLWLAEASGEGPRPVYRTARVGLSLKRSPKSPEPPRFVLRPYRYLTEPRRTAKGKLHLVLALHVRGVPPDEVHQLTGCPKASVRRYLDDFEAGRRESDFGPYYGKDLSPKALCRLHGTWHARWGNFPSPGTTPVR